MLDADASFAPQLRIEGVAFDHVAVAAPRLRDLLPLYADLLGGQPCYAADHIRYGYRALQLGFGDGSIIELMEPLAGSDFFDSFFRRTRGGGVHHVTFRVDDLTVAIKSLYAGGFRVHGEDRDDPDWQEVFIETRSANGVLLQLAQTYGRYAVQWPRKSIDQILAGQSGNGEPSP